MSTADIPLFQATLAAQHCLDPKTGLPVGGPRPGYGDVVTLSTGKETIRREQMRVRWAQGVPNGGRSKDWVALSDFIQGEPFACDIEADDGLKTDYRGFTRMMKFPSGEMPDETGDPFAYPGPHCDGTAECLSCPTFFCTV